MHYTTNLKYISTVIPHQSYPDFLQISLPTYFQRLKYKAE